MNPARVALHRRELRLLSLLLMVSGAAFVKAQPADGPADRLARFHVPDEVIATGVSVYSAAELVAALADTAVSLAVIHQDIQLRERDFAPYVTPFNFTTGRNFTMLGAFSSPSEYPVLDLNFIKGKVRLGPRSLFELVRLVLVRTREGPQYQEPGLDLCTVSGDGTTLPSAASITAVAVLGHSFLVQRGCLPRAASDESVNAMPRPPTVPGTQAYTRQYNQTGCSNATSAPAALRCWPAVSMLMDIVTYAVNTDSFGKPVVAGYVVRALMTPQACGVLFTDECVQIYGTTGCFYRTFPRLHGSSTEDAPPPAAPPASPLAAFEASGGGSSGESNNTALLAGLLGGLLGGLLLLALLALLVWRVCKQRRLLESRAAAGGCSEPSSVVKAAEHTLQPTAQAASKAAPAALPSDTRRPSSGTLHGEEGEVLAAIVVERALVPVTPLSPVLPGIDLECTEVELTNETLGRGAHGRVVVGSYAGAVVAVKLLDLGLLHMDMVLLAASKAPSSVPFDDSTKAGVEAGKRPLTESRLSHEMPAQRALRQEVEVLARCCHPNVVKLLAASTKPPRLCLVMEKMETSLDRLVHGEGATLLPLPTVLHIASQIASALAYLHPTVLHRDLKPANILIANPNSPRPTAKLADFGLSRLLSTVLITKNPEVGTVPYMAPEAFDLGNLVITDKVDIYAFAVVLWEMLTAERPWSSGVDGEQPNAVVVAFTVSIEHMRPSLTSIPRCRCPAKLEALIRDCWDPVPERRPCAAEAVKTLALITELLARPNPAEALFR